MHKTIQPRVLYFGTPVVLVSTRNSDGSANLAPMSSAWWLGRSCMLGLDSTSQTTHNLLSDDECVLNLASVDLAPNVDKLAMLTGTPVLPDHKRERGFRYEPDKFGVSGLSAIPSEIVTPPRVAECQIQLEGRVVATHAFGAPHAEATSFEIEIVTSHVHEDILIPHRPDHIDPLKWDPLIMKFTEFFGACLNVHSSRLAKGFVDHSGVPVLAQE